MDSQHTKFHIWCIWPSISSKDNQIQIFHWFYFYFRGAIGVVLFSNYRAFVVRLVTPPIFNAFITRMFVTDMLDILPTIHGIKETIQKSIEQNIQNFFMGSVCYICENNINSMSGTFYTWKV